MLSNPFNTYYKVNKSKNLKNNPNILLLEVLMLYNHFFLKFNS